MAAHRWRFWAALTGLALGLLALGPALRPGFTLAYDMVFVPHPDFSTTTFGLTGVLPRQVPSDAVVTTLTHVLPGDLVQKPVLLAIFVMACMSAAELVPDERLAPRLAAGICYAWNPFVAERLLLGQWALLLGYAGLPWVVAASRRGGRGLVRALVPAAIGGFAAVAVSGVVALAIAATVSGERASRLTRAFGALLLVGLPWLVTGFFRPGGLGVDTAGVAAFSARADTPFGPLGSLLLLGGVWNKETIPAGYGAAVTAVAWLVVVVVAIAAYAWLCRTEWASGLAAAAVTGFVLAALGVVVPGLLRWGMRGVPALAVLRDGQQFVAPLAVLVAVGLGLAVGRATGALGVLGLVAPLALLPALAWGASGRLQAVHYPADWARARHIVAADRQPGAVLLLPWAAYRSYDWNGLRRTLDPLPRYLDRRVVWNDGVVVGRTALAAEDPRARSLDPVIRAGGPLTEALRQAGIRYVALDAETTGPQNARLPGAERVLSGADLVLYRIPGEVPHVEEPAPPTWAAISAWLVALGGILWSFLGTRTTLVTRLRSPHP